jgi:hypothetical protein
LPSGVLLSTFGFHAVFGGVAVAVDYTSPGVYIKAVKTNYRHAATGVKMELNGADQHIKSMMLTYPTIFRSRLAALQQLFMTNGNGCPPHWAKE